MSHMKSSGFQLHTPYLSLPYLPLPCPPPHPPAWTDRCLSEVAPCRTPFPGPCLASCHLPGVLLSPLYHANFFEGQFFDNEFSSPNRNPLWGRPQGGHRAAKADKGSLLPRNTLVPFRAGRGERAASSPAEVTPGPPAPGA